MIEHVLAIAGAELEPAQELRQLLVKRADVRLLYGLAAQLLDVLFHLLGGFFDHLFDPRWVDTAVLDQLAKGQSRRFAADVVEGTYDDHSGSVVNDDIDPGTLFKSTDVSPFAANDAALHVVA